MAFINYVNVFLQMLWKGFVTRFTFVIFVALMNCMNVRLLYELCKCVFSLHMLYLRKEFARFDICDLCKIVSVEIQFFFMNCVYVMCLRIFSWKMILWICLFKCCAWKTICHKIFIWFSRKNLIELLGKLKVFSMNLCTELLRIFSWKKIHLLFVINYNLPQYLQWWSFCSCWTKTFSLTLEWPAFLIGLFSFQTWTLFLYKQICVPDFQHFPHN